MTPDEEDRLVGGRPWDIDEAVEKAHAGAALQRQSEADVRDAYKAYAEADENYRKALARKIVELRASGASIVLSRDLARGDEEIAMLKRVAVIAEGVKEAAHQASWRRSADRRDIERFSEWSMRRNLAENR